MKKALIAIVMGSVLWGCIDDPTTSEALCQAQVEDATAVCTDTSTDVEESTVVETSTETETATVVE